MINLQSVEQTDNILSTIWTITKKEIYAHLLTFRFTFGTIIAIVLISLYTIVLRQNYEEQLQNYNLALREHHRELAAAKVYPQVNPKVERPPELLSVFNKGLSDQLATTVSVSRVGIPGTLVKHEANNEYLTVFQTLDLSLIIEIVFSLLALLFAFDCFSGERENGSLRQMISNQVPRYCILLGKYFGAFIILLIALIMGVLCSLIILINSAYINFDSEVWLRIAAIMVLALIYISIFLSLGMLFSALSRRSATALAFSLFCWIFFIIIYPRAVTYFVCQFSPLKVSQDWNTKIQQESAKRFEFISDFEKKHGHYSEHGRFQSVRFGNNWDIEVTGADDAVINYFLERARQLEPIILKTAEKMWQIELQKEVQLKHQKKLINFFSGFSPAFLFLQACSIFARTDAGSFERFFKYVRDYRLQLIQWLKNRNATGSRKWVVAEGELDISDLPQFKYVTEPISQSLNRAMFYIVLLIFFNFLFFLLSFVAFLKYDVR